MKFAEFQKRTRFGRDEVAAFAEGRLLEDAPAGLARLPGWLLLPFHEITRLEWDEASGTGVIEAARDNRLDDWYYGCHFIGDPVMPGCWGVDAVWQCLRFFAAWRGLAGCSKPLGMENVSFFGQIRPHDKRVVYRVEIVSVERDGEAVLLTGKGSVEVDGTPVYTIASAQIGTDFWESPPSRGVSPSAPASLGEPMTRRLPYAEFKARSGFSRAEIIALSRGVLVADPPGEIALLPSDMMLEVGRVERIAGSVASGEGVVEASRENRSTDWFYAMTPGVKPAALSIDAVWQLIGLFQAWGGSGGTGRALGFERVDVFSDILPQDRDVRCDLRVVKSVRSPESGDVFVRADATVYADGRPVLSLANANVGCHKDIRYADYPLASEMAFGGKLKTRKTGGER
ncbi:MAG TPA: bifunctional 3-hydroxydecanoyl-ACP dehydratase/trans-2-decenoyl-ACP isomerase [Elusimicrobiota bacterium]|nr:bifunctional 3-hydroxydecanoyl-ACP dehydratase/trans-2-decenoyl-ACP isomerase [Elusimicrobiota bacterium]